MPFYCEIIAIDLPIMLDMNLDLSMGGIHFDAIGKIAGQVAPKRKPRSTLTATIHPKPKAAADGERRVSTLARRVLYPKTRLFKKK